MKKTVKNKLLLMGLLSLLNSSLVGCGKEEETPIELSSITESYELEINESKAPSQKVCLESDVLVPQTEEIQEEEKEERDVVYYPCVRAKANVNIRDNAVDGNILGVLKKGSSLKWIDTLDNGWFKVEYYGNIGYISGEYAYKGMDLKFTKNIMKIFYCPQEVKINVPFYYSETDEDEVITLPKLECLEVYAEDEDYYLVRTNDYIGYVEKHSLEELEETFVVVDISDQELTLYKDNEIILKAPVVTGHPDTPSDKGLFEIYDISYNRDLVGPDYKSYVDIMMKYNGGEGLHDATYHTHEDGRHHGWREIGEFGGETYLTDGSHGCVNMMRDDVMEVSEYVDLGTKVLVKQ